MTWELNETLRAPSSDGAGEQDEPHVVFLSEQGEDLGEAVEDQGQIRGSESASNHGDERELIHPARRPGIDAFGMKPCSYPGVFYKSRKKHEREARQM